MKARLLAAGGLTALSLSACDSRQNNRYQIRGDDTLDSVVRLDTCTGEVIWDEADRPIIPAGPSCSRGDQRYQMLVDDDVDAVARLDRYTGEVVGWFRPADEGAVWIPAGPFREEKK